MCSPRCRAAALAALFFIAACTDRQTPLEPARSDAGAPPSVSAGGSVPVSAMEARNERLARRFALALRDQSFRATVYQALQQSTEREGKIHLQRFLGVERGRGRLRLAELAKEPETAIETDLDESPALEVYLPVPEHRSRWRGSLDVLVATAEHDQDIPVAFDLEGRRRLLDRNRPPSTPVIALGRAETAFTTEAVTRDECFGCITDPGGGGYTGGGSGGGGVPVNPAIQSPGLYLTYAKYNQTFEGWLKGDPEFEIHILGQDGSSNAMKSYQCAGEKAGAPYQFDQNDKEWSGSVLLFSETQMDTYTAQHPNQALRVFVVEDDDGACLIKTDSARVEKMFQQLIQSYGDLTGGKKEQLVSVKTFQRAVSLLRIFRSAWSVITTADDVVGTAIQDVVAQEYFPGANWIVKGENNITNGALRLEMR